ncbi:hypothetical protein HPP92_015526 [Vanilla planifolia]|uniref:Uncharacterized protein n=1 Tax=Vanilla planifolia TaxID=51239 RepID=A0A835USH2_VANPL|nr:hypothetical protein HPP92_015526 [Vanilla planifolia]
MTAYRTKGTVSEDDVYALVQRYGATTIFTILQEVSQATEKDIAIDWRAIVKTTASGITNVREYQMLWRHLAYRDPMEKIEDGAEPLSDESDLEFELEATPTSCNEALNELDCYIKVLLSSGSLVDSSPALASNFEASPTTDTPNDHASVALSDKQHFVRPNRAANADAVLSSQKQSLLAGPSAEGLDGTGPLNSSYTAKKKRKLWTKEEDMELIAAVDKFGEGNWANILKGDFKHDRTASQLSQRWSIIRKRQANSNHNSGNKSRSEEMLAAQKAFSMALNMPMPGGFSSSMLPGGTQMQTTSSLAPVASVSAGAPDSSNAVSQAIKQTQQPFNQESCLKGAPNPSSKSRSQKKPPAQAKPSIGPNPLIKAAAFAAGGRIATPSTAASLFKAAQSKNAVRIRHGGNSSLTTTAAVTGAHGINVKFIHAPASSTGNSGTSPLASSAGQAQVRLGNASLTTSVPSQPLLESKSGVRASCGALDSVELRQGIIISAVDVDELLAEDARVAQEKDSSEIPVHPVGNGNRAVEDGNQDGLLNENQNIENDALMEEKPSEVEREDLVKQDGDLGDTDSGDK